MVRRNPARKSVARCVSVVALALAMVVTGLSMTAQAASDVVTIYGWSGDWDLWFQEWGERFERETGIQVQYISGGGVEIFSRLVSEKDHPRADLLLSSAGYLFQADNMGLLQPIPWDRISNAQYVDDTFKYPSISVFGYDVYHLAYNTRTVQPGEEPQSWSDLADPMWKGRLIQRDPASDLTAWIWMAINDRYGEEAAWAAIEGMFANSNLWVGTVGDLVQALAMGEADVAPASIGHVMLAVQQAGGEVASAMPEIPILMLNGLGLVNNGPNTEGAVKFIDFFLSTYVQDFIMNKAGTSLAVNQQVELTNRDLVEIGLGGVEVDEILEKAYSPDWTYWTEMVDENRTRLGVLSSEIARRVKGL